MSVTPHQEIGRARCLLNEGTFILQGVFCAEGTFFREGMYI